MEFAGISMAFFKYVLVCYEKLAWIEGCIMNDEGREGGSFVLGRKRLTWMEWHHGFCGVLSFCNDTKLNFIMATGSLMSANFIMF